MLGSPQHNHMVITGGATMHAGRCGTWAPASSMTWRGTRTRSSRWPPPAGACSPAARTSPSAPGSLTRPPGPLRPPCAPCSACTACPCAPHTVLHHHSAGFPWLAGSGMHPAAERQACNRLSKVQWACMDTCPCCCLHHQCGGPRPVPLAMTVMLAQPSSLPRDSPLP